MACTIEVLFTPAEFRALRDRDLSRATCVVFDVLRATSTFVTALANGAEALIPVEEIPEALKIRRRRPDVLLAGERHGLRITAAMTGGVEFDLGNSPREFTPARVKGRTIVSTTTNGTRALRACAPAAHVLVGSFLNLNAVEEAILAQLPAQLLLVCAGTGENAALEDTLAAGALCDRLVSRLAALQLADSGRMAWSVYRAAQADLPGNVRCAQNARRLLAIPDLAADVEFCILVDRFKSRATLNQFGHVRDAA